MFCEKCGTQNNDTNSVCVNCGATLRRPAPQQPPMQQPPYQQPAQPPYRQPPQAYQQQPSYGYAQPQQAYSYAQPANAIGGSKPTVLYIIAGVLAALGFVLVFLPHIVSAYGVSAGSYNLFQTLFSLFAISSSVSRYSSSSTNSIGVFAGMFVTMFVIPMALQIVWAIMSFMRKRPAGVFGVIASSIYTIVSLIWLIVCVAATSSSSYVSMTAFPPMMMMVGIAGIPVSIVQIVKKKYL